MNALQMHVKWILMKQSTNYLSNFYCHCKTCNCLIFINEEKCMTTNVTFLETKTYIKVFCWYQNISKSFILQLSLLWISQISDLKRCNHYTVILQSYSLLLHFLGCGSAFEVCFIMIQHQVDMIPKSLPSLN
jgi:hypothetical protein